MKQTASLILLAALIGAAFWWLRPDYPAMPSASLSFTDGSSDELQNWKGKPLLVSFWSVSCPACLKDRPKLAQLHQVLSQRGGSVLSISMPHDPPPVIIDMVRKLAPPYPTALDVHGELNRAFGNIEVTPTTLLINRQGKIVHRITGELDLNQVGAMLATL